jgi:hypothetical protein
MIMNFGKAIEALKQGKRVARKGWNGKGMWVAYIDNCEIPYRGIGIVKLNPFFVIKNVNGTMSTWVPSINDSLAEDWQIVS